MYGGVEETITLRLPNRLIGVVIDRFGKDLRTAFGMSGDHTVFIDRNNLRVTGNPVKSVAVLGKIPRKRQDLCRHGA